MKSNINITPTLTLHTDIFNINVPFTLLQSNYPEIYPFIYIYISKIKLYKINVGHNFYYRYLETVSWGATVSYCFLYGYSLSIY